MMARPERSSGIDQKGARPRGSIGRVSACVHDEPPFPDRLQPFLAHRDPIGGRQRFDDGRDIGRAGYQGAQRRQHRAVGLALGISVEPPALDVVLDLFGSHQHGVDREISRGIDGFGLSARAGQRCFPTVRLSGHSLPRSRRGRPPSWRGARRARATAPSPLLPPAWRRAPAECRQAICRPRGLPNSPLPCPSS